MTDNRTSPINIPAGSHGRRRGQSVSFSDSSSDSSSGSPSSPVQSPLTGTQPRIAPVSPGTSPILNYFLAQSPKSPTTSATFPFRRGFGSSVFDEDAPETEVSRHARRASTAWAGTTERVSPPQPSVVPDQTDRAAGLLRRLSLGGAALRPQVPQIKTTAATASAEPEVRTRARTPPNTPAVERPQLARKPRRATLAPGTARPKRAPSPMGERILTGHFDGFN